MPDSPQYWKPPDSIVRVIEQADLIRVTVAAMAPSTPQMWGHPLKVDPASLADDVAELAGREMTLSVLVDQITKALINRGWIGETIFQTAVDITEKIVESDS